MHARTSPDDDGRTVMHMRWLDLCFIHWRVPAAALRPLVPEGLDVEEYDGTAWIGLVPFTMTGVRFAGCPRVPTMHAFHECNVRTYVRRGDAAGVWFFSLDATSRLAVRGARWRWSLNYQHARIDLDAADDEVRYAIDRRGPPPARLRAHWRVGEALPTSAPDSLEHFLTERYWLFTQRGTALARGRVRHVPWPLRSALLESLEESLVAAAGVHTAGAEPDHVMAADPIDVEAEALVPA